MVISVQPITITEWNALAKDERTLRLDLFYTATQKLKKDDWR